jgi:hypothetical protein
MLLLRSKEKEKRGERRLGPEREVPIEKPKPIGDVQHATCGSSFKRHC